MSKKDLEANGLYELLGKRGFIPRVGKQRVSARKATASEAQSLDIDPGSPVLTMERTAYDSMGLAIEHGEHSYRTDMYSLEFTVVSK
jgi:DNA-binding GntR family transcriptional regulator